LRDRRLLRFLGDDFFGRRGEWLFDGRMGAVVIEKALEGIAHLIGAAIAFGGRTLKGPKKNGGQRIRYAGKHSASGGGGFPRLTGDGGCGRFSRHTEVDQGSQGEEIGSGLRAESGLLFGGEKIVVFGGVKSVGFPRAQDSGFDRSDTEIHELRCDAFAADKQAASFELEGFGELVGAEGLGDADSFRVDAAMNDSGRMARSKGLTEKDGKGQALFGGEMLCAPRLHPFGHRGPLDQFLGDVHLGDFAETVVDLHHVGMEEGAEGAEDLLEAFDEGPTGDDLGESGSKSDGGIHSPVMGIVQVEKGLVKAESGHLIAPTDHTGCKRPDGGSPTAWSAAHHERLP